MGFILFLAFILTPVVEIAVFIEVGGKIGVWSTVGIIILTAVMGSFLLRRQGLSILFRIEENLKSNRMPVQELFDGVCLVVAGALLLTPGFVTDALGFMLFVPPIRQAIAGYIAHAFIRRADFKVYSAGTSHTRPSGEADVIEGEYEDITPDRRNDPQAPKNPRLPPDHENR